MHLCALKEETYFSNTTGILIEQDPGFAFKSAKMGGGGGQEGASGSAGPVCWQRADFKAIGDFKALAHNGMKYFLNKLYCFLCDSVFTKYFLKFHIL